MPAPPAPKTASPTPSAVGAPQASASTGQSQSASPRLPATHQPTPQQQNPAGPHRTLAPTLPPENTSAPNPLKELNERQRSAISSRVQGFERQQVSDAGVDGTAAQPKGPAPTKATFGKKPAEAAASGGAAAATPTKPKATATPSSSVPEPPSSSTSPDPEKKTGDSQAPATPTPEATAEAAQAARLRHYEPKEFKRWAEENPEKAVELGKILGVEPKEGFIQLQNKARKIKTEIREEREASKAETAKELAQAKGDREKAESIAGQLRWMSDLWGAAQKKDATGKVVIDFDTADEAFRQNMNGISIDDYMRQRSRRGIASPELARERARAARLESELAEARKTNGAAASGTPALPAPANQAAPAAPAASTVNADELWGGEIPKAHPLREFKGWADDLHKEMQRHHDETLDQYDVDPEEIADSLLKRKLAALAPDPLDTPAPGAPAKKRPNTPKRRATAPAAAADGIPDASTLTPKNLPAPPSGHKSGLDTKAEDYDGNWAKRQAFALDRHNRRMRGEAVD